MKVLEELRIATANLADFASDMTEPSVRLGVTGLARAGKTIFISSSLHNIIHRGTPAPLRGPRHRAHWYCRNHAPTRQPDSAFSL